MVFESRDARKLFQSKVIQELIVHCQTFLKTIDYQQIGKGLDFEVLVDLVRKFRRSTLEENAPG